MSVSRRFNENWEQFENIKRQKEGNSSSYFNFIHWLALRSCSVYKKGIGFIFPHYQPTKVDFMFNKEIKLLVSSYIRETFLVTENGETHHWDNMDKIKRPLGQLSIDVINYYPHKLDWSKEYIVKTATNSFNFLTLTDVGKIYYKSGKRTFRGINEIDIKKKITCIGCGYGFYVVVTNNGIYSWGVNNNGELGISERKNTYAKQPCEVTGLSGKTIVKVACGREHTLALSDEGKVYAWGLNSNGQSNFNNKNNVFSPIMVNIANVRKVSDIATMKQTSFVKSSKDGLVYIWGFLAHVSISKPVVCERTNVFDVCNSMMAQSPISMIREYTDQEFSILNDLENAFDDPATSDLIIDVKKQFIFVHKAILKIRCQYFRKMFQFDSIENDQGVIEFNYYSYVVYKFFIQYLYTGTLYTISDLASLEDLLDLLILADEYCEKNLERDCIRIIKKRITISNIFLINKVAKQINKEELEQYCFDFFLKNQEVVMQTENWITQLDLDTKIIFITKANRFFTSCF